jgi:hypothetical protein
MMVVESLEDSSWDNICDEKRETWFSFSLKWFIEYRDNDVDTSY